MSNQQLTAKQKIDGTRDLLMKYQDRIAGVLPKHLTPERMIQVAMAAMGRTPELLDCTPASIIQSVMTASELGLDLNPVMGHGAIIPRKNKGSMVAQFQPMYKGFLDLCYRSGRVTLVDGHIVHENDEFRYSFGLKPDLHHQPAVGGRGKKVGAYVVAHVKGMAPVFHYMSRADIEAHRNRYSKAWNSSVSPWAKFHETEPSESDGMWLKTVFLQLCRWLPKSTEMANLEKAVHVDYEVETGDNIWEAVATPTAEVDINDAVLTEVTEELEGKPEGGSDSAADGSDFFQAPEGGWDKG